MPFEFAKTRIPDIIEVTPRIFPDDRGGFAELFKASDFAAYGLVRIAQVNQSQSVRGTLRGLHYQVEPRAQGKLVMAVSGEVYDVGVDLRRGSPTHGAWVGRRLDAQKMNMLFIPAGFAHGFSVLSETAAVIYYCTDEYSPEHERGIAFNDPQLNIDWLIKDPLLSPRDRGHPLLKDADYNFSYRGDVS